MVKKLLVLFFSALLSSGSVANAQLPTTQGWFLGLDIGGAAITFDNQPRDRGPLVGGRIGYGIKKIVALYAGAYEVDINVKTFDRFDKVTFGHVDFGLRIHWPNNNRRWVPYGDVTMTFWPVSDVLKNGKQTTTDFSSLPSSSLGGGIAVYVSKAWALDVNIKFGKSLFKDVELDNIIHSGNEQHTHTFVDIPAASARLSVGIMWWL